MEKLIMFKWLCFRHSWDKYGYNDINTVVLYRKCSKCGQEQRYHMFAVTYANCKFPEGLVKI